RRCSRTMQRSMREFVPSGRRAERSCARRVVRAMTKEDPRRRDLLKLLGVGGVVFASGLVGCGRSMPSAATPARKPTPTPTPADDFIFLQLSDTHWGFEGQQNPEASHTLADDVEQ